MSSCQLISAIVVKENNINELGAKLVMYGIKNALCWTSYRRQGNVEDEG
jgi:hypothetical protein